MNRYNYYIVYWKCNLIINEYYVNIIYMYIYYNLTFWQQMQREHDKLSRYNVMQIIHCYLSWELVLYRTLIEIPGEFLMIGSFSNIDCSDFQTRYFDDFFFFFFFFNKTTTRYQSYFSLQCRYTCIGIIYINCNVS